MVIVDSSTNKEWKPRPPKKSPEEILAEIRENGLVLTPKALGPWSHSKLKMLQSCHLQFLLQYILKVKVPNRPVDLVTETGKAAHRVLELVISGISLEKAFSQTKEEYKGIIPDSHWESHLATIEFNIIKFMEKIKNLEKSYKIKQIFQELRIGCTDTWAPTEFFADDVYFRGVIDLVLLLDNDDLIIIDHKYGAPVIMGLKYYLNQLDTYKILFHKGVMPIEGATSGIHFIKDGETLLGLHSSKEEIDTTILGKLEFYIEGAVEGLLEKGEFKHTVCTACKYCDFKETCKAKGYKKLEDESKNWFNIRKV